MNKRVTLIFLCVIIFIAPVHADDRGADRYTREIYRHFSSGDYYRVYDSIERLLLDKPLHHVSALFISDLVELADVVGSGRVEQTIRRALDALGRQPESPRRNSITLRLTLALEELLYAVEPSRAVAVTRRLSPLRSWLLMGPFSRYGRGDLHYSFPPETMVQAAQGTIESRAVSVNTSDGELDISSFLYPERGVAYAVTSFAVKGAVKLRLYADTYYKVFINGDEALVNGPGSYRNMRILNVHSNDGITLKIKLSCRDSWKCRVLVTDEKNIILNPACRPREQYTSTCRISEAEEYPHGILRAMTTQDPAEGHNYLGQYYGEYGSALSVHHFERSLAHRDDHLVRFLCASEMIDLSRGDRNSSLYARGWQMMNRIARERPSFIPARGKLLDRHGVDSDTRALLKEGQKILHAAPAHLITYIECAKLLSHLGYEYEFDTFIRHFRERFPFSRFPFLYEAAFYRFRNRERYIKSLEQVLDMWFHRDSAQRLVRECIKSGRYKKAQDLLNRFNRDGVFNGESIALYIKKGDYAKARALLIREVARRNLPEFYYRLGDLNRKDQSDPFMYWLKSLDLKPSMYSLKDYMTYLEKGMSACPFNDYATEIDPFGTAEEKEPASQAPAGVLLRERIIRINRDGTYRAFCRDLIRINTEQGADTWGEFPVPYRTDIQPVRIRTFSDKDTYSDYFTIQKVDSMRYISVGSLAKGSVLDVSYITGDLSHSRKDGLMVHHPVIHVQNFDEPVDLFRLTVISPTDMPLRFYAPHGSTVREEFDDARGERIYRVEEQGLPVVHKEQYSGSPANVLPFVLFTSMDGEEDFRTWYRGLIAGKDSFIAHADVPDLNGGSTVETVENVYYYILKEIALLGSSLYSPSRAADTLFRKRGSAEDRVILAKTLLQEKGIYSCIAFARDRFLPPAEAYISPETFTDMLLYVPLDQDRGIWLDFSQDVLACGMVKSSINGAESLVLFSKRHEYMTVSGEQESLYKGEYVLSINNRGAADIKADFVMTGHYKDMIGFFQDDRYHEETAHAFASSIFPSIDVTGFTVSSVDSIRRPFALSFKGVDPNAVLAGAGRLVFQPVFNKSDVYGYVQYPQRSQGLVIREPVHEDETYTYELPDQFNDEQVNITEEVRSPFGFAKIVITKEKGSNRLRACKKIHVPAATIKPRGYQDFLRFCLRIRKYELSNVMLSRPD